MRKKWVKPWLLNDELNFLDGIGTYSKERRGNSLEKRISALRGYLSAPKPPHWTTEQEQQLQLHTIGLLNQARKALYGR